MTYIKSLANSGTIKMHGVATAPTGWLLCDNAAVSRTTYASLFTAIGTTFGVGDGSTTFNVPDMRGIFPRGAGVNGTLSDANGTGFTGVLGTYQNDSFQAWQLGSSADDVGVRHYFGATWSSRDINPDTSAASDYTVMFFHTGAQGQVTSTSNKGGPKSDGTNGVPRTGTETNPANLGLTFIIKV